jgi:hypothetical protein
MNLKEQSISPVSIMLFIHIIALSNFFHSELSEGFKQFVENNIFAKQLIIFLTILTIISQIYSNESLWTNLFITIVIYFLLLFITNSDYRFHVGIFVLLSIFHLYENKVKEKQKLELSDPNLNEKYKEEIIKKNFNKEKLIYGAIIVLIISGAIYYEKIKQKQFGKNFSLKKFLFT